MKSTLPKSYKFSTVNGQHLFLRTRSIRLAILLVRLAVSALGRSYPRSNSTMGPDVQPKPRQPCSHE